MYDEHAELIHKLARQAVAHFKTFLKTDDELHNILSNYGKTIYGNTHMQIAELYFDDVLEFGVVVNQGLIPLKPCAFTAEGDVPALHQAPDERSKIAQYVDGALAKDAYSLQKFHSDTERILAGILKRAAGFVQLLDNFKRIMSTVSTPPP